MNQELSIKNKYEYKKYQPVIGLEIHVELKTNSKMFCGCPASYFGHEPNTHCCPICLGLPGALPVPNRKAVEWCVMLGLALNCEIPEFSKFDRKNYFYPDLPKGYQISQYDQPFCIDGWLTINNPIIQLTNYPINQLSNQQKNKKTMKQCNNVTMKKIRIRRVHMEEDTGKLLHAEVNGEKCTLIDFNRSGVPLVEIVTEPDIGSSEEAKLFLKRLDQIIRYLGISDCDMEKGSMRLEPNVSVRALSLRASAKKSHSISYGIAASPSAPRNDIYKELPNYKVEVKNINSFNFVKKAIDYEIKRQIEILKKGETPKQETRGWNEEKRVTQSQRSKEEAHDYRYFPEPDIPPIRWAGNYILNIKNQIPELPGNKLARFIKQYGISEYDAMILIDTREIADYYEKSVKYSILMSSKAKSGDLLNKKIGQEKSNEITPKMIANWIINKKADFTKVSPEEMVNLIAQQSQKPTISDEELEKVIKKVLIDNPKAVADYKSGKGQVIMFLVGQVMREIKAKGEADKIKEKIISLLH